MGLTGRKLEGLQSVMGVNMGSYRVTEGHSDWLKDKSKVNQGL